MKVTGPTSGPTGIDGGQPAQPVEREKAAQPSDVSRADAAPGAPGAAGADPLTADIAAELQAGRLGAKAALDRIIERVIDKQLGVDAPAAAREKLRAALQDTLADDPFLAEKIREI
jgi:hypothetical protein